MVVLDGVKQYTRVPEMSSNNPYRTDPFKRNDRLTAAHLETLRDGTSSNIQLRNPDNFVKRYPNGHILTSKKKSKGGAQRPYIIITTATDENNYIGDVIKPTDATVIKSGVTIKALQPSGGGALPIGTEFFADFADDVYYIQPAVFYGT